VNAIRSIVLSALTVLSAPVFADPVETEIPNVTAEVAELRTSGGVTRLAVRFINSGAKRAETAPYSVGKIVLVDTKSKQKHFPLKDADGYFIGGPIGDSTLDGGRLYVVLEAGQQGIAWAYFNALPTGTVVSVEVPQMFPFEDVVVTEGPGTLLSAGSAKSSPAGAVATLASAKRADQALKVQLKLAAEPGVTVDLRSPYFEYKDVYLFDPAGKRKYPLLKDTEGFFQAQPLTVKMGGGRIIPDWKKPILMSLAFQAPPDNVKTVDLILPDFQPFQGIAIEGLGGAGAGGIAAAGKSLGLEGALKELQAEVTAQEIKIDLSADVLFDFDKADLKPAAEAQLNNLLTVVNSRPDANVAIEGHTDVRGDASYNQTLSQRRAESVSTWLSKHGVAAGRINATGAGETRPISPGDADADHQTNRRVEIRIRQRASATTGDAAGCLGADPKVGIAACTRLIEQSAPGSAELASAYATRAKHYVTTNDLKSALADANEALRLDPLQPNALHNRALIYFYLGQYDEALADINKEIEVTPEDAEAYASRARIYAESEQPDAAMADLNKALAIDPRHVDALNSRGAIYTMSGKMDAALADFNAVLAIDPKNADAYSSRGGMYLMTNRLPQALADLDQAIRLNPTDINAFLNRGMTYLFQKRFDQAIADFTRALALEPGNAHLHFQRATAYFMSGRVAEGLADADLTIRSQPDHLQAHQLRAAALEAMKRPADALDAHRRVLKLDPTNQQSLDAVQRLAVSQ
jgi:outer membrane protein OmpA-like peptidoglycan-associated protein/Tfp pilus assembly protein PilF